MAALVVAVVAIFAAMHSYEISSEQRADKYTITAAQARFAPALELLPSGAVAYITDMPAGESAGAIALMAAQYALAPHPVVPVEKSDAEWAVGNFARPANFAERGAQLGFRIVRDFGNGVVVYRRAR